MQMRAPKRFWGTRRNFAVIGFVAVGLAICVGVAYAYDWNGAKLTNILGITIGGTTNPPDRSIWFDTGTNAALLSFRGGPDQVVMRGGADLICLGYDEDTITFNTGDGHLVFGGDWSVPTADKAWMNYTDSSASLDVGANGDTKIRSVNGDVVIQLGE